MKIDFGSHPWAQIGLWGQVWPSPDQDPLPPYTQAKFLRKSRKTLSTHFEWNGLTDSGLQSKNGKYSFFTSYSSFRIKKCFKMVRLTRIKCEQVRLSAIFRPLKR
jgi:hypothetical protein